MVRSFMMIALGLSALSASWAQGTVIEWSFEAGLNGWSSVDPAGRLDVTYDATIARVAGGGVAEYVHEAAVGKLGGIAVQLMVDTARAKSVRFWLRTSAPTLMLASLTEKDGSNYHAPFQSLANVWQDISLDLSDFRLGEDSQDENSLLDPGQINAIPPSPPLSRPRCPSWCPRSWGSASCGSMTSPSTPRAWRRAGRPLR